MTKDLEFLFENVANRVLNTTGEGANKTIQEEYFEDGTELEILSEKGSKALYDAMKLELEPLKENALKEARKNILKKKYYLVLRKKNLISEEYYSIHSQKAQIAVQDATKIYNHYEELLSHLS